MKYFFYLYFSFFAVVSFAQDCETALSCLTTVPEKKAIFNLFEPQLKDVDWTYSNHVTGHQTEVQVFDEKDVLLERIKFSYLSEYYIYDETKSFIKDTLYDYKHPDYIPYQFMRPYIEEPYINFKKNPDALETIDSYSNSVAFQTKEQFKSEFVFNDKKQVIRTATLIPEFRNDVNSEPNYQTFPNYNVVVRYNDGNQIIEKQCTLFDNTFTYPANYENGEKSYLGIWLENEKLNYSTNGLLQSYEITTYMFEEDKEKKLQTNYNIKDVIDGLIFREETPKYKEATALALRKVVAQFNITYDAQNRPVLFTKKCDWYKRKTAKAKYKLENEDYDSYSKAITYHADGSYTVTSHYKYLKSAYTIKQKDVIETNTYKYNDEGYMQEMTLVTHENGKFVSKKKAIFSYWYH